MGQSGSEEDMLEGGTKGGTEGERDELTEGEEIENSLILSS